MEEIITKNPNATPKLSVCDWYVYLNKAALIEFNLKSGDEIRFIMDDDYWWFYKAKKGQNGSYLLLNQYNAPGCRINSKALVSLFWDSFSRGDKAFAFKLKKLEAEMGGNNLIELDTKKILQAKMKKYQKTRLRKKIKEIAAKKEELNNQNNTK